MRPVDAEACDITVWFNPSCTGEPVYRELELDTAARDDLLDAMAQHPILIERPIVIRGDRAVVARPPERLLELLDT